MAGSDVLLTGATGYAGSAVLTALVAAGRQVTALVQEPWELSGARTVVGTLGMLGEVADEIGAASAIVHLASGRSTDRDRVLFEDIVGTGQLLDAWRSGPFVFASTTTIHGLPTAPITPATPVDIADWYGCGKVVNEFQVRDAAAAGIPGRGPGIALRPSLYFGASRRPPTGQYLAWFLDLARAGRTLVFDTEEAISTAGASYVGLGDFGRAVAAALGLLEGGAYPVASGFTTWSGLLDAVNRAAGTRAQCAVRPSGPQGPDEVRAGHSRTELDASAFTSRTGWTPRESLDELVDAFVCGEREAGRA